MIDRKAITKCFCTFKVFVIVFLLSINKGIASSLNQQISELSDQIITNKVQLTLIDKYIVNLQNTYNGSILLLQNKSKEFATSVSILYKFKTNPKELLLIENLSQKETLNTFAIINYWLKSTTNSILRIYLELDSTKELIKKLNLAKQKVSLLNKKLFVNQKNLNSLLTKNNLSQSSYLNKTRELLKYNQTIYSNNKNLFANIDKPLLTKTDKKNDYIFIKQNKGTMEWPNKGTITSRFNSSTEYSLTYYGIVINATSDSNIYAPADGEIIFCDFIGKYNKVIMIKHSPSFITVISGNFVESIKLSQIVKKGEIIGNIKNNNGSPIYLEIDNQSAPVDPSTWLRKKL